MAHEHKLHLSALVFVPGEQHHYQPLQHTTLIYPVYKQTRRHKHTLLASVYTQAQEISHTIPIWPRQPFPVSKAQQKIFLQHYNASQPWPKISSLSFCTDLDVHPHCRCSTARMLHHNTHQQHKPLAQQFTCVSDLNDILQSLLYTVDDKS